MDSRQDAPRSDRAYREPVNAPEPPLPAVSGSDVARALDVTELAAGHAGGAAGRRRRRRHADRGAWRRTLRTPLALYVAGVEIFAVLLSIVVGVRSEVTHADLWRALLIGVSCVVFEMLSHRVASMRTRLAAGPVVDMGSVWTFGAAIALPPPVAACIAAFVALAAAQARRKGPGAFYREAFNAATNVITAVVAGVIVGPDRIVPGHSTPIVVVALIAAALVAYFLINSLLVGGAFYASGSRGGLSMLFGTLEENWLELATLMIGALIGVVLVVQPLLVPITILPLLLLQRGALVKHLEEAASTDQKTGLLNATTWRQISDNEVARAVRSHQQVAVLIVDMDNFKNLNDTHGHLLGDDVLKAVARCMTEELRTYDPVGRFGGEEFVALLTDSGAERAQAAAERILQRIRALRVPSRDGGETIGGMSASIGAACFPGNGPAIEDLLMAADAALYRAKRAGRDRVVVAAGDEPVDSRV